MHRREFITLLGGAAAAWPLAARGQQRTPVIGLLLPGSAVIEGPTLRGFLSGLREAGFVDGQNVTIEYRYAENQYERFPALAADLVRRRVDVIVAQTRAVPAARQATSTIPIVFIGGGDPVRNGFVASLNRPTGNVTGATLLGPDIASKYLGLLHEAVPQVKAIGILVDPTPQSSGNFQELATQAAARNIGVSIRGVPLRNGDLDAAFATLVREGVEALLIPASTYFFGHADQLAILAERHHFPALSPYREFVQAGGLMSYGPSVVEVYRQGGLYAGRILKGAKPADLPVMQPTKFEFLINLKTVKALGLTIPAGGLAIVDEVIE